MIDLELMSDNKKDLLAFVKHNLVEGLDFGKVPGIQKPCLFKPGAEKLMKAYNLSFSSFKMIAQTEDFVNGYLDYVYSCGLQDSYGKLVGYCEASCNSEELRFRNQFKNVNPGYAVLKNKNSIMKMSQKRAFVGAVLVATSTSEFFTQDMEDVVPDVHNGKEISVSDIVPPDVPVPPPPVEKKRLSRDLLAIINVINSCDTKESLRLIYDNNKKYHNVTEFLEALSRRKKEIIGAEIKKQIEPKKEEKKEEKSVQ